MNLISPGDLAEENEFLQLAQSLKYSSAHGVKLAELRPGLFAVYDFAGKPLYVGEDWTEVLEAFRNRPAPPDRKQTASNKKRITDSILADIEGAF